jgi:hypothetical protein
MPNGTIAVIKETDNHRAQPDLDTLGGVTVAAGTDGQEGALAGKFMESLQGLTGAVSGDMQEV